MLSAQGSHSTMTFSLLRHHSIRTKLLLLIAVNSGLALLLVGLILFGYERFETRDAAKRELASLARIVADSSAAPLTFLDEHAAAETLNALRNNEDMLQAAIYTPAGKPFASYYRMLPASGNLSATTSIRHSVREWRSAYVAAYPAGGSFDRHGISQVEYEGRR